jgi:hypothetical protein
MKTRQKMAFFNLLIVFLVLIAMGFFEEVLFYSKQSKSSTKIEQKYNE